MTTVGVLTDTTASIPEQLVEELGIELVPYYIIRNGDTLRDVVDVDTLSIAQFLETRNTLPTTSNPSPGDYYSGLKNLAERTREILALTMTSKGSGAYQSCRAAIELIREHIPNLKIDLLDTRQVAMAQGWVAVEAARAALQGLAFNDVVQYARDISVKSTMIQTADTLRYLYMGGRIGRAQHLLSTMLNIKPLIGMEDGVIVALGTARTRSKAYSRIVELMRQRLEQDVKIKVAFTHVAALEKLEMLREKVVSSFDCVEVLTSSLSPALAVHSGPGTVGISYYPVYHMMR